MAVPRAVRSFIGISSARSRNTRPRLENSSRWACDGGVHHVVDEVLLLELRALHPPAAAALGAEGVGRHRLHVAGPAHGDDHLLVVDQVLDVHVARIVGDHASGARWRTSPGSPRARRR